MKKEIKMLSCVGDNIGWSESYYIVKKNGKIYSVGLGNGDWNINDKDDEDVLEWLKDLYDKKWVMISREELEEVEDCWEDGEKEKWLKEVFEED